LTGAADNGYVLEVTSKGNGGLNKYKITEAAGVATRTCGVAGKGACPSTGTW